MKNLSLTHLSELLSECVVDDTILASDIFECLMSVLNQEEEYFSKQINKIRHLKDIIQSNNDSFSWLNDSLMSTSLDDSLYTLDTFNENYV